MSKINLKLKDEDKAAWVDAAWAERVSLSEWIRRACADRLAKPLIVRIAEHPLTDEEMRKAAEGFALLSQHIVDQSTSTPVDQSTSELVD